MHTKKLIKLESTKNFLYVYWRLTDFCNYKCNYCVPELYNGNYSIKKKDQTPSNEDINKFIKKIKETGDGKDIYFSLSGGEPTLHPMFPEILKLLREFSNVEIITNGSRPIHWWKSLGCLPNIVRISLHPEYTQIDKINNLANYILENESLVRFNLSMDSKNWDKSILLYNQLEDPLKKFVRPKILHDWTKKSKVITVYTAEQKEWIKQFSYSTSDGSEESNLFRHTKATYSDGTTGLLDFVHATMNDHMYFNWQCSAGSSSISINVQGEIYAGICKQQMIGTVTDFELLKEYLTCKSIFCQCPTDLLIPKYKKI